MNILVHDYKLFSMKDFESIGEILLGLQTSLMDFKFWEKPTSKLEKS